MSDIGTYLRRAREQAGLSRQDLSARTKIREALLDLIERGEFERLPAGLLMRGYLRAYAQEVGLEPEVVVRKYAEELGPESHPVAAPNASADPDAFELTWPEAHGQLLTTVVLTIAAIAVLMLLANRAADIPASMAPEPVATAGTDDAGAESQPPAPVPLSGLGEAVVSANSDRLVLEITPLGIVWVEASADGKQVLYQLVQPNERTVLEARDELDIRIGDAAAIEYSINGKRGRPLGGAGEIRHIRITHENYTSLLES